VTLAREINDNVYTLSISYRLDFCCKVMGLVVDRSSGTIREAEEPVELRGCGSGGYDVFAIWRRSEKQRWV